MKVSGRNPKLTLTGYPVFKRTKPLLASFNLILFGLIMLGLSYDCPKFSNSPLYKAEISRPSNLVDFSPENNIDLSDDFPLGKHRNSVT